MTVGAELAVAPGRLADARTDERTGSKPHRMPAAIIALAGLVLVCSRVLPLTQSLWADEIKSITTYINHGPAAIFGHYIAGDHILFELLAWASTAVTGAHSEAAYRFWGVVPGLAAGVLLAWWLWNRVDPWVAALFALLATASPIYYSLCIEARGYGLGFLASSCMLIGADGYVRTASRRALALFGVAAAGGIWTLPVFVLPVLAIVALMLISVHTGRGAILLTAALLAGASLLFYAPVLGQLLTASQQNFGPQLAWYGFASGPFSDLLAPELLVLVHGVGATTSQTLAPGVSSAVPGTSGWTTWVPAAIVLTGFGAAIARERFLALGCLAPAVFTYAVLDAARAHTVNRFASFLLLPLLILGAIALVTAARLTTVRRSGAVAALVCAAFMLWRTDEMLNATLAAPYENDREVADLVRGARIDDVLSNSDGGDTDFYLRRRAVSTRTTSQLQAVFCRADGPFVYLDELLAPSQPPTACLVRRGAVSIQVPQRHTRGATAGSPFVVWLVPGTSRGGRG